MERYCISMSESDVDNFERGRAICNMNKSAYLRLLIAEHENRVPNFIRHKELIEKISETNEILKEIALRPELIDEDVLSIHVRQNELEKLLKEKL